MDNKEQELYQFYEDVCNLGRVLPNLAASVIYTELNNFKDNPDRVQLILKKYFSSYEPEVHNCMSDDIKKIKRVVPNYPFIHINNDLLGVEDKDNRVQLVLKNYFDTQLKLSKRASDDISDSEASPKKKAKTDEISTDLLFEQANLSQNYSTTSETESYTTVSASDDIIDTSKLERSEYNDQNSSIVTEKENLDEIPVVSTSEFQIVDISQPNKQIVETNKDSDNLNLCNTPENPISILSLLSSLFPQHSSEILKIVCENYAVVPDDPPDEATMNMMVQVMLNQNITDDAFQQDKTEICENQIPVSTCSSAESNEKILTQEDGMKENEDINLPVASVCDKQLLEGFESSNQESTESYKFNELHDYLQEVVNGFVLDLSQSADNNTALNNSIIKPATFDPKQNAMSKLSKTGTSNSTVLLKGNDTKISKSTCVIKRNNTSGPSKNIINLPNSNYNSDSKKDKNILQLNTKTSGSSKNINYLNTTKSHIEKKEPVKTATVASTGAIRKSHLILTGTSNSTPLLKVKDINKTSKYTHVIKSNNTSGPSKNISNLPNLNYNSDSKKDKNILQLNTKTTGPSKNINNLNTTKSHVEKKEPVKTAPVVSTGAIRKSYLILTGTSKSNIEKKNPAKTATVVSTEAIRNLILTGTTQLKGKDINKNSKNTHVIKSNNTSDPSKNILQLNTKTSSPSKNINNLSNSDTEENKNIQLIQITTQPESNIIKINQKLNNFVQGLTDCRPSTSGLRNIVGNAIDTSTKSSIRVRTDLYEMFYNRPVYESSSESSYEKDDDVVFVSVNRVTSRNKLQNLDDVYNEVVKIEENSTDGISRNASYNEIVSVDRLGDGTPRNILQNDEASYKEIVKVEETSTYSEEPSASKTQLPSDLQTTHPFYFKLLEIFPDICPNYLKKLCSESTSQHHTMDDMVTILLNGDYKKRDRPASPENVMDFEEQHKILQDLFPDADPSYLQHHCERVIDSPEDFKLFVTSLIELKDYPTKADYLKKMKLSAQEKQYTTEFNVEKFLEVIPNPEEHFNDPKRRALSESNFDDINYAITFLKNTFCTTVVRDIISVFKTSKYSVIKSAQKLEKLKNMKTRRRPYPVTSCKNIPLLQEIAYVKHKPEILLYLQKKELEKQIAREHAKSSGLLKTCQCCYDDEIMPEDIETCESGKHLFCKECIKKGCEVIIGDGKLEFPCLETCDSFFTLQVLQTVLTPKVFSKMAQRKQMEEVKSAGIEDLESCPFCDFATIPAPGDKIFRCLNDDCMKESCRLCKEPSHIPLRCDELEKDKDVKIRTYIENKMTEALLRICYKCGLKFIKESGCNKMTCSCGAMMCYVCNKPVTDYRHFNGQGGDQYHLCPLYSDTHKLHMDAVKQSAESAMKELGVNNTNELKIDPTTDLEQHYKRLAVQNPAIPNVQMVFPNNVNVIPP